MARGRVLDFFRISNFDRSQFCSPLSYDDEKWLIWKPQAISIGTWFKKQYSTTFNIYQDVLKSANLLHKRGIDDFQLNTTVIVEFLKKCQDQKILWLVYV